MHYKEQKSIQLTVLYFITTTHAKFIKTLSIAQAISYKSQSYLSLKGPTNQLVDQTLKTIRQ